MGRILGQHAGRRMFVGVLALAGLALAACAAPLKQAPEPPPPKELPPICVPDPIREVPGVPNLASPAPAPEPGCTPICLPGQGEDPRMKVQPAPEPTTPDCVPICPPSDGGGRPPEQNAQAQQRCVRIPIPCVPGAEIPDCVNFCPPGQEAPAAPAVAPGPDVPRCTPLCTLIPPGLPGACDRVELPRT
jgi:hypothetical protein